MLGPFESWCRKLSGTKVRQVYLAVEISLLKNLASKGASPPFCSPCFDWLFDWAEVLRRHPIGKTHFYSAVTYFVVDSSCYYNFLRYCKLSWRDYRLSNPGLLTPSSSLKSWLNIVKKGIKLSIRKGVYSSKLPKTKKRMYSSLTFVSTFYFTLCYSVSLSFRFHFVPAHRYFPQKTHNRGLNLWRATPTIYS